MDEQSLISKIFQEVIFFAIIIGAMALLQRSADLVFNKYFERLRLKAIEKGLTIEGKRYVTLATTFRKITSALIWATAILVVLGHYGVNIALLLSGAGAAGIIFGIAGKDIIMDYYTGAMVLIENQYRVGDVIKIDADHSGAVENVTLRTVILRDIDGNVHTVPHRLAPMVINMTFGFSRVNLEVGVAYDSDMEKVAKVVNEVGHNLSQDQEWNKLIIEPIIFDRILSFDDSQVTVRAIGDVEAGEQWAVSGEFNKRLKLAFDKNDIEIPFPQRVMHMAPEKHPKK